MWVPGTPSSGLVPWECGRSFDVQAPHGGHSDLAGRLPILRPAGPRHLRRKAKNLRNRLTNYFQDLANLHPRTQQMVTTASAVQWTVVRSEVEALTLEFTWIKEFNPRFNVMFKDDKSYPYLAVSMGERFPRVQVTRERKRAGSRYFGPYTQVWAIRETIDQLLRVFPMRSCSAGVFQRAKAQGRPCLLGYIDKCAAPCVGRVSMEEHCALAEGLCQFMEGRTGPVIRDWRRRCARPRRS